MNLAIRSGALVPVLLMLPNVVWIALPKVGASNDARVPGWLNIAENLGRLASLALPIFYALDMGRPLSIPTAIGMGVTLAFYYICWLRYFTQGRAPELLKAALLGIPLPMAVAPVLFLLLASYLMDSWVMLAVTVWFGIAHIWVSAAS